MSIPAPEEGRPALRQRLLAARAALGEADHQARSLAILHHLRDGVALHGVVGFYWPFQNEWDPRPLILPYLIAGGRAALPVVIGRGQPLEFRLWTPDTAMAEGPFRIPYPAAGEPVRPDLLLVSLLGFDARGYRLGYGGGFYDRTLAGWDPRPATVGVGFELGRLGDVEPHAHDIPLDRIATEAGLFTSLSSS